MLLFEFHNLLYILLLYLNFLEKLPNLFHHILQLLLYKQWWQKNHQKANAAVCVPALPKAHLAVFKLLPVAQEPAVVTPPPFKVLEVVLYQICPTVGLAGSDATANISCPYMFM
jgi:hypothetical protein